MASSSSSSVQLIVQARAGQTTRASASFAGCSPPQAQVEGCALTVAEKAGPFEAYRWATSTGSYHNGHPRHGTPQSLIVDASRVLYRAPIFMGPAEAPDGPNPLFRLVSDMLDRF